MQFVIDEKIINKFPSINIGVIIAKNINNVGESEEILNQINLIEEEIRKSHKSETLSQHPKILAWRKAYSDFGGKPKENRSSVENLYRRVLHGSNINHINKLVDIYNLISLKHMLPVGGEDLGKIKGNISLTFAGENEPEVWLLGDKEPRPPHQGEVIYKDDISAICRRWNWREAERTKLTESTKNCILVIEGLFPAEKQEIESATNELKELINKFCNGTVTYNILNKEVKSIQLL